MVANIVVRQFPPKLSLKIDVNKEFLKMETTKVPWLNKGSRCFINYYDLLSNHFLF